MRTPNAAPSPLPRLLSVREVAAYLGVCTKTVRRLIAAGALPTTRIGHHLRIVEADLAAYLAQGKTWRPSMSSIVHEFQRIIME